jgi:DnaK suppressor protein
MMTHEQLSLFKKSFLEKRGLLLASLQKAQQEDYESQGGDEVDQIQTSLLNKITTQLSQRDLEKVKYIDLALKKIEEGSFGICEECEEEIGNKRLLALPQCKLCISCQEMQELAAKRGC